MRKHKEGMKTLFYFALTLNYYSKRRKVGAREYGKDKIR